MLQLYILEHFLFLGNSKIVFQDDLDSLMNDPELLQELVNQVPSSNQGNSNNEKVRSSKNRISFNLSLNSPILLMDAFI